MYLPIRGPKFKSTPNAFGVLLNLGPRIGKYNEDGSANEIEGHSLVSSFIGLLMLIVGFFGFLGACLIWAGADYGGWVNIYGAPATLSSFANEDKVAGAP